jgi:fatty acid desaturase
VERLGQPGHCELLVGISYGWWQREHNRYHANPNKVGANPDVALAAIAMTPERAMRFRGRLMRWLVAHQGCYFFPILLLLGVSLHTDGIRRVISRDKIQRRWVELSLLALRLGGLVALVFLVLPRGRRSRSSRCSWLCSVCTWAHRSRPTTSACRSCRPR